MNLEVGYIERLYKSIANTYFNSSYELLFVSLFIGLFLTAIVIFFIAAKIQAKKYGITVWEYINPNSERNNSKYNCNNTFF